MYIKFKYLSKEIFSIILLVFTTIIINYKMIRDGLNGQIDSLWHITWLQHFFKHFSEGVLYPRWLAGTNYGYGSPTFVFYPPLTHYFGSLIRLTGLTTEKTLILFYSLLIFFAGFNFYLYARNRWGRLASLFGAIAYTIAPYLIFNIYWVNSLSTALAIVWVPLLWLFTDKSFDRPRWKVGIAIGWMLMALTHLPSLLLTFIVWSVDTLIRGFRDLKTTLSIIARAFIGLGMATFFLIPAIFEQSYINLKVMLKVGGGFPLTLLGYPNNSLIPLRLDGRPPQIFVHQSLGTLLLVGIAFLILFRNNSNSRSSLREVKHWLIFMIVIGFFMSGLSWPLWQLVPQLQTIQAPWRMLFLFSFAGAAIISIVVAEVLKTNRTKKVVIFAVLIGVLLSYFNYDYRIARRFPTLNNPGRADLTYLTPVKTALTNPYADNLPDVSEYRPAPIENTEIKPRPNQPLVSVLEGEADVEIKTWESYLRNLRINVQQEAVVRIRTFFFPAWQLLVNDRPFPLTPLKDTTIGIKLPPGQYEVTLSYQKTPAFQWGILISITSFLILALITVMDNRWKSYPVKRT